LGHFNGFAQYHVHTGVVRCLNDRARAERFANDKRMPIAVAERISGFALDADNGGDSGFESLGGSGNGQREQGAAHGCGI
jgi:hypothetical protein